MRCVILSACPVSPELKRLLRPDDFIIACDAGYRNCAPLGCKPNIILGDFDTAPCPVQQNRRDPCLPEGGIFLFLRFPHGGQGRGRV